MFGSYRSLHHLISDLVPIPTLILVVLLYGLYYYLQAAKQPVLICSHGLFKDFLLDKVPTLNRKYCPTFWCIEGRLQTVIAAIVRRSVLPAINYRREIFTLRDGGVLALDWLEDGCDANAPCIIFLPGVSGDSQSDYMQYLVPLVHKNGFRVVVFHNRGTGGVELRTPKFYCASKSEDFSEVARYIREVLPFVKIGAAGISMGGLILGNYLVQHKEEAGRILTATKIISAPFNIQEGSAHAELPILNGLLGRRLTGNLLKILRRSKNVFDGTPVDFQKLESVKTLREFDDKFTIKNFGYSNVEDYYQDATLHTKICEVNVPMLCLNAADDPFQPYKCLPLNMFRSSSHVAIIVTAKGGHIGFMGGSWPFIFDEFLGSIFLEYFKSVLLDDYGKFESVRNYMTMDFNNRKFFHKLNQKLNF